jgi:hypothetical protein
MAFVSMNSRGDSAVREQADSCAKAHALRQQKRECKPAAGDALALKVRAQPRAIGVNQPVTTRFTAFGPLPFLSGSTSKLIR